MNNYDVFYNVTELQIKVSFSDFIGEKWKTEGRKLIIYTKERQSEPKIWKEIVMNTLLVPEIFLEYF